MAEKEERIRVLVAKNPCKECSVKKCTRKCMFGLLFEKAPGMTRQELITRMAEAMNDLTRKSLESKKTPCIPPETYAEAMLNSILEVK